MKALSVRSQRVGPSPTLALTAKAKEMKDQGIDVVGFAAGEPDFDTPENIKQAAIRAIEEGFTKYTVVGGIPELREAIAAKLKRENNLDYTIDEIVVCNGGKHALYNIFQALLNPGDEVLIPAPYWVSYPDQVLLNDGVPMIMRTTDKTGFKITPEQLAGSITPRTKAVVINSPSNPTGSAYTGAELKELAQVIVDKDVFCISDEIYERITYDGFIQESIVRVHPGMRGRTFLVNGVSKAYAMTGWRMGYVAGPSAAWIKVLNKIQGQVTSNISSMTQKACIEAYQGSQETVAQMVAEFSKRRHVIVDRLNDIPGVHCSRPEGAFYVFPSIEGTYGRKTPKGQVIRSSLELSNYLLNESQVVVVPGEDFGAPGYMRLSYATSMAIIEKGLFRIDRAIGVLQ